MIHHLPEDGLPHDTPLQFQYVLSLVMLVRLSLNFAPNLAMTCCVKNRLKDRVRAALCVLGVYLLAALAILATVPS